MAVKAATLSLAVLALSALSGISSVTAQGTRSSRSSSSSSAMAAASRQANPSRPATTEHPTAEEMAVWYWTGAQSVYWVSILFHSALGLLKCPL